GFLAKSVLEEWGVRSTEDLGNIVFNLVEAELLSRTESDTRQDFVGVYDFGEAFEDAFRRSLQDIRLTS
ncbi:MAG: Minf_1886 family protein, partial [Planctomycetota bacterium]